MSITRLVFVACSPFVAMPAEHLCPGAAVRATSALSDFILFWGIVLYYQVFLN
jgi:hypothetical protein